MKWIAGAAFVTYFILATIALSQNRRNHQSSPTILVRKFPTLQHYATVRSTELRKSLCKTYLSRT